MKEKYIEYLIKYKRLMDKGLPKEETESFWKEIHQFPDDFWNVNLTDEDILNIRTMYDNQRSL